MQHKQQGFTLIELMIVVAIIGILAAIAIPARITRFEQRSKKGLASHHLQEHKLGFFVAREKLLPVPVTLRYNCLLKKKGSTPFPRTV